MIVGEKLFFVIRISSRKLVCITLQTVGYISGQSFVNQIKLTTKSAGFISSGSTRPITGKK
jgi:hypothetical protein